MKPKIFSFVLEINSYSNEQYLICFIITTIAVFK